MVIKVMLMTYIVLWLFVGPCRICLSKVNRRVYVRRFDEEPGNNVSLTDGISETDCARQCMRKLLCRRFAYNTSRNKCHLSRDVLLEREKGGATYGQLDMAFKLKCSVSYEGHCPIALGYEYIMIHSRYHCLKTTHAEMNYIDGMGKCLSEDAHLVSLESQADMDYILTKVAKFAWIDGGKNLQTWFGGSLQWSAWSFGHPMTDLCPFVANGFGMLTTACNVPNVVPVCQIDV